MTTRTTSALVLVVALVLATASVAHAASITIHEDRDHRGAPTGIKLIDYAAAPGEANRLRILMEPQTILFRDEGAEITASPDCTAHGPHEVSCPRHWMHEVTLGDMDDSFSGEATMVTGGDGDDRLVVRGGITHGGVGADVIEGSSLNEDMTGGPGADVLLGHDGEDVLTDGEPGTERDVFDGGSGHDRVVYASAGKPSVDVDLNRETPNGAPGEDDRLVSIEGVRATGESVRLTGSPLGDHLSLTTYGASPVGIVRAGAGSDRIEAEDPSSDYIRAGPGRDELSLGGVFDDEPAMADDIGCGSGLDTVDDPNRRTVVPTDCETVRDTYVHWQFELLPRSRSWRSPVVRARAYFACEWFEPCGQMTLKVWRADARGKRTGPLLGRASGGVNERFSLRLNPRGRRTLARWRSINALIELTADDRQSRFEGPSSFLARLGAGR